MKATSEIQAVIDSIRHGEVSEQALITWLADERGLIRANVLMALPKRKLLSPRMVVEAVVQAALDPMRGDTQFMGTVNQRRLAAATLVWMNNDVALEAYEKLTDALDDSEKKCIQEMIERGPIV